MDVSEDDRRQINNIEKLLDAEVEKILLRRQVLIKRLKLELSNAMDDVEEIVKRRRLLVCPVCDRIATLGTYSDKYKVCDKCINAALEQYRKPE